MLINCVQVMKNSGCEVPEHMLSMKKASRDERKKLAERAPRREPISKLVRHETYQKKRREEMIAASKKRKREGKVKNVKKKMKDVVTEENNDEEILSDELD